MRGFNKMDKVEKKSGAMGVDRKSVVYGKSVG